MYKRIDINYTDLVQKEKIVMDYALKFSDHFSILATIKKPYSKMPPNFTNSEFSEMFEPFVIDYILEKNEWPVDFLGKLKHQIMVIYKSCKDIRLKISQLPNLFLPVENDLPEDICFYRNKKPWFATVSHEKMAFMLDATKDDLTFLEEQGIHFYG